MLLAACVLLLLLTLALIVSVAQLAALIPQYTDQLNDALKSAGNALTTAVDPGQIVDLAMSVLSATLGVIGDLFFLVTVLLFMAFDTDSTRRSLATLGDRFPNPVAALDSFARDARSYMSVSI